MSSSERLRVGLTGLNARDIPSLHRTKAFWHRSLLREFDVTELQDGDLGSELDALVNFRGSAAWGPDVHPNHPIINGLHGGPVLSTTFIRRKLLKHWRSDLVLGNCSSDARVMRSIGNVGYATLPLPVALDVFHPDAASGVELPFEKPEILLGFVGRMMPQKNPHRFLEILAGVQAAMPDRTVEGLMIGDLVTDYSILPYTQDSFPTFLSQRIDALGVTVHCYGGLSDRQLAAAYASMDLLVHPTHVIDENYGYVAVEAMACGTPVVGCGYGGLKDTVVHGQTGFLLPTWYTPGGLRCNLNRAVRHCVELLGDPEALAAMQVRCRDRAKQHYSDDVCGAVLRKAVRDAVDEYRSGNNIPPRISAPWPEAAAGPLPDTNPRWESFEEGVSIYCSAQPPIPDSTTLLHRWAEVESGVLADPTWPARAHFVGLKRDLWRQCPTTPETASRTLQVDLPSVVAAATDMVAEGYLVA